MFEHIDPDEEMSAEEMLDLLSDPDRMEEHGYRITPKGCMALILMKELGLDLDDSDALAQRMDNLIFMNRWIYMQEDQVRLVDE